jgi:hypothetical protein
MPSGIERHVAPESTCFILVSSLPYFSTLKTEATCSSETSVDFQTCYIPEDRTFHSRRCENLKSYLTEWRLDNMPHYDFAFSIAETHAR